MGCSGSKHKDVIEEERERRRRQHREAAYDENIGASSSPSVNIKRKKDDDAAADAAASLGKSYTDQREREDYDYLASIIERTANSFIDVQAGEQAPLTKSLGGSAGKFLKASAHGSFVASASDAVNAQTSFILGRLPVPSAESNALAIANLGDDEQQEAEATEEAARAHKLLERVSATIASDVHVVHVADLVVNM